MILTSRQLILLGHTILHTATLTLPERLQAFFGLGQNSYVAITCNAVHGFYQHSFGIYPQANTLIVPTKIVWLLDSQGRVADDASGLAVALGNEYRVSLLLHGTNGENQRQYEESRLQITKHRDTLRFVSK